MQRIDFIKSLTAFSSLFTLNDMFTLNSFKKISENFEENDEIMPVFFIGHGSPMNAIEDNEFTKGWKAMVKGIAQPKAILCVSAHWETKGTMVTAMEKPKTIHDFGGFPKALFDVEYAATGSKWLAEETKNALNTTPLTLDEAWGLDHGAWSVLKQIYPKANIPVVQLSLDYTLNTQQHFDLAKQLAVLRKKGVLIIGSGNMVHNFQYAQLNGSNFNAHFGHDWAIEANETFKKLITANDTKSLINFQNYSRALNLAAPTPDHYLPLIYSMALRNNFEENVSFFNDAVIAGSFSMTSLKIG